MQFYTSLAAGSPSSTAALNATPSVRSATTSVQHSVGATDSGVAGLAPSSYDVSTVSQSDLKELVPIVIVLLALLLGLLLRSVVAPLYLVATVLLSYFAALGIAVLLFQIAGGRVRAELRAAVPAVHLPDGAGRGLQHPGHEPDPGGGAPCAAAGRGRGPRPTTPGPP